MWKDVNNAFCPTGVGGGVDATCSPNTSSSSSSESVVKQNSPDKKGIRTAYIDRTTTGEGVPFDIARKLTKSQAKDAVEFRHGISVVVGNNAPNKSLPEATRPELSLIEQGALQKYSYNNDVPLNGMLRGDPDYDKQKGVGGKIKKDAEGNDILVPYNRTFYDTMHQEMQSAFDKAPVFDKPVAVTRGMGLKPDALKSFTEEVKKSLENGTPLTLAGYTSTSKPSGLGGVFHKLGLSTGIHKSFAGNVEMQINAVHGLDVKPYSQIAGEGELLLNHDSQFRVRSVSTKGGKLRVKLDQLPPERSERSTSRQSTTRNSSKTVVLNNNVFSHFNSDELLLSYKRISNMTSLETTEDFDSDGNPVKLTKEEKELKEFYKKNPEAMEKWIDRDVSHISFDIPDKSTKKKSKK